jgi:hypothetical protein
MSAPNSTRWLLAASALAAGVVLGASLSRPAAVAQTKVHNVSTGTGPRYTVVFTEGTNLCVTDNQASKVYFYTIDQGQEAGADLKLRASVDLAQVGKEVIKPALLKKK